MVLGGQQESGSVWHAAGKGKDEGTGSVSATRNWHCTELTDCPGWPRCALTPALLLQGSPLFPLPQAARLKWSVGTDGWGTASRSLSCWGLRISH